MSGRLRAASLFQFRRCNMEDYSKNIVKKYKYWTVYVHTNQSYLGRCIIWCNREDALDLSEATADEQQELFFIIKKLRVAIEKTFNADWMNYSFLGNEMRHLHGHAVPRYKSDRIFKGILFKDSRWGHNWMTDLDFNTTKELLQAIKNGIIGNLNKE